MIDDQSVIRDMPGAYDVCLSDANGKELSNWQSLAPRGIFDPHQFVIFTIHTPGYWTKWKNRDGEMIDSPKFFLFQEKGMQVKVQLGEKLMP